MSGGAIGPHIAYGVARGEPGYDVSMCLEELAAWAMGHGVAADELRDLLEDAIDSLEEDS